MAQSDSGVGKASRDSSVSTSPVCGKSKGALLEVSPRDASIRRIPIPDWDSVDDAIWLRDQTALVVIARETATAPLQIWKVAYPSGGAARVTNDTNSYNGIALSPDSRRLVATQIFQNTNIWTAPTTAPAQAKQLTFGSAAADGFYGIAFAADGKIIYTSPRDGHIDLWEMNPDENGQRQLTKNVGDYNDRPNVTLDGRFVCLDRHAPAKTRFGEWKPTAPTHSN